MSLSGGWEVRFSNSRRLPYFYNPTTRASMWELPDGITEEQARALPGGQLLGEASQSNRPAQVVVVLAAGARYVFAEVMK